jgi:hypothetical protein
MPDRDDDDSAAERDDQTTGERRLQRIDRNTSRVAESTNLLASMSQMEGRILASVDAMTEKVDKIDRTLNGEGDGKTGITARVTKLEDAAASRTAVIVATISAAAAIAAAVVAALIALGHHAAP